jgi:magnesium transporter
MIRAIYRDSAGHLHKDLPPEKWREALADKDGLLWVDLCEEPVTSSEPLLRDIFKFHPLAIDDALRETHIPKVDNWGEYIYAVLFGVTFITGEIALDVLEVDVFLAHNHLVTHHPKQMEIVNRVWNAAAADTRRLERGPDFLLYDLLDLLAADFMPVVDAIDDTVDHLEDDIFQRQGGDSNTLNTLFTIKRVALQLRRIISPQREVLNRLARDDYAVIDIADRVYFRDVYDHMVRLADINEGLRDLISGALETYLSVTSNRTNEIMKVLTIISALFMPLAFISGFFGMNFTLIPFDSWVLLVAALLLMGIIPLGMLAWFKRQGWL